VNAAPLYPADRGRFTLDRLFTHHCPELEVLYQTHPGELRLYSPRLSDEFAIAPETTVRQLIREQILGAHRGRNFSCGIWVEGRLVGQVDCVYDYNSTTSIELGCWIIAEFQGQGIVYESCEWLLDYCFTRRNVKVAWLRVAHDNIASRRLAAKLGFHPVGEPLPETDGPVTRIMQHLNRYAPAGP
jgi:RimJ/RimL family protein N-acetyltransferase